VRATIESLYSTAQTTAEGIAALCVSLDTIYLGTFLVCQYPFHVDDKISTSVSRVAGKTILFLPDNRQNSIAVQSLHYGLSRLFEVEPINVIDTGTSHYLCKAVLFSHQIPIFPLHADFFGRRIAQLAEFSILCYLESNDKPPSLKLQNYEFKDTLSLPDITLSSMIAGENQNFSSHMVFGFVSDDSQLEALIGGSKAVEKCFELEFARIILSSPDLHLIPLLMASGFPVFIYSNLLESWLVPINGILVFSQDIQQSKLVKIARCNQRFAQRYFSEHATIIKMNAL
jgi:hypothetical protein